MFTLSIYARILPLSTLKSYHHGDLRTALLDATTELVRECGIEGLSLREVSRRAGVSHTAAYNHFADKSALVAAFVDASFARFRSALEAARDAGTDPRDALRRVGIAYVLFAHANPQEFKIMFRPELSRLDVLDGSSCAMESYGVLVQSVATALEAGAIAGDADAIVRVSWAVVHGLAALIVDGPSVRVPQTAAEVEAAADESIAFLFEGIRPARGALVAE